MSNPYFSLLRTAWRNAGKEQRRLALIYGLFVVTNILAALKPALYGWLIDRIQLDPGHVRRWAWIYAGIFVGLHLIGWCINAPCRVIERSLAFNISLNFLRRLYHQALHLPLQWHQDHHSGATINRVRKGYEALRSYLSDGFEYMFFPFNMALSLLAMVYFSPIFGGIGLLMAVLTIWVIVRYDKALVPIQQAVNEREHDLSANMFDTLSNIITVITLRIEKSMEAGLLGTATAIFKPFRRWSVVNESKWFVADTLVALTYTIIVLGYVYQNWTPRHVFYVGGLVTLIGYVNQFTSYFHSISWQYSLVARHNTDVEAAQIIEGAYRAQHRPDAAPHLPSRWRVCRISGLKYVHRNGEGVSIENIAIQIERGKRVALVGESGAGKSTLLSLLRGLYQPQLGYRIDVDGYPWILESVNEVTTLVPQEPEIFENTIEYNVTLGLPFPKDEIRKVCEVAHFTSVLDQLPKGLASNIQEKGVNLSGGQKQRLALARGILAAQESDIVLLDEPTSSVDPKTELQIYEKLFREFKEKAIVCSHHRLHLLDMFDDIYVLHRGNVVAHGTIKCLLQTSYHFRALWETSKSHI